MWYRRLLWGILVIAFFAGCGGNDNPVDNGNTSDAVFQYFPNTVGSSWQYYVYDHIENAADTITVMISGTKSISGVARTASVWTFTPCGRPEDEGFANRYDTLFVTGPDSDYDNTSTDSVIIYSYADPARIYMKIMLPLSVGRAWSCPDCHDFVDTTSVHEKATITTMAGTIIDAFRLYELYDCGDTWYTGTYSPWIKPGIGFVRMVRTEQDARNYPEGPQLTASWELMSYHIAK